VYALGVAPTAVAAGMPDWQTPLMGCVKWLFPISTSHGNVCLAIKLTSEEWIAALRADRLVPA